MITVKEVTTRKEQKAFLDFPLDLYAGNPCFVPPLYMDEKKIFRNDYVYRDCCDFVSFLAYKDGIVAGRIQAIIQKAANEKNGEKRVRFNRFDAIEDFEVSQALFEAAEKWALEKGMDTVCGPLGFSDLEREGLLVEGFDQQATFEENYNAPYYGEHIERLGYVKEVDWLGFHLYGAESPETMEEMEKTADFIFRRYKLHLGPSSSGSDFLKRYADGIFGLIDKSYDGLYGTVPFTEGMRKLMIDNFKLVIDPKYVAVVLDENDRMVCFGLTFPALAGALAHAPHGHPSPEGPEKAGSPGPLPRGRGTGIPEPGHFRRLLRRPHEDATGQPGPSLRRHEPEPGRQLRHPEPMEALPQGTDQALPVLCEETRMIKLLVDCFGGDHSPEAPVAGALAALAKNPDLDLILTGDESILKKELEGKSYDPSRLEIVHAPEVIGCDEKPTDVVRLKRNSSMMKAIMMLRDEDDIAGMVSTGSTGALVTGALVRLGRIRGIIRPAFCPILPTMDGGLVGICDSGANVEVTPAHLRQFAIMASLYMQEVYGIKNPRTALLNVGKEAGKGDDLRRETYALLQDTDCVNFVGNMESRDLLSGSYDVVVTDGFSGNVLVKTTEGTALELLKKLKKDIHSRTLYKLGGLLMKRMFLEEKEFMNYQNYGGSVLLGTSKVVVKGHGSSKAVAVEKCIEQAYRMEVSHLSGKIEAAVARYEHYED